jgi:hypothetical protein
MMENQNTLFMLSVVTVIVSLTNIRLITIYLIMDFYITSVIK